jgi:hypothetical protein
MTRVCLPLSTYLIRDALIVALFVMRLPSRTASRSSPSCAWLLMLQLPARHMYHLLKVSPVPIIVDLNLDKLGGDTGDVGTSFALPQTNRITLVMWERRIRTL